MSLQQSPKLWQSGLQLQVAGYPAQKPCAQQLVYPASTQDPIASDNQSSIYNLVNTIIWMCLKRRYN